MRGAVDVCALVVPPSLSGGEGLLTAREHPAREQPKDEAQHYRLAPRNTARA